MHTCKECGAAERNHWMEKTASRLKEQQLCFTCDFWFEKVRMKDEASVRVKGIHYRICDENSFGFRGYGGRRFVVKFFDGRVVVSTNLWCQGEIPARFRALLPDNAEFDDTEDTASYIACGPSTRKCKCSCPDFCEHTWDGPVWESEDGCCGSVTCSRCGMVAIDHDVWVLP